MNFGKLGTAGVDRLDQHDESSHLLTLSLRFLLRGDCLVHSAWPSR